MTQNIESAIKPTLHRGFPLPICDLSPDSFEDFVYQALSLLGKSKRFEMQSGRQPSGDQGFDCTAKTKGSNELICIQCKRYNTTLQKKTVAEEVIKVALEGILNRSTVKQHYIITSGTVSGTLRQILRQDNYLSLKDECKKIIENERFQPALLQKVKNNSIDPISAVKKYIDSLDQLLVWSGVDFQNELLCIWSSLHDVLEKNFSIEAVLKDKPTPDFNLNVYLNKKLEEEVKLAPLYYNQSLLPNNLKSEIKLERYGDSVFSIDAIISLLKQSKCIVLSSPGGSGKSSSLSIIEKKLVCIQSDVEYIPVKIKLRSYSRNTLNNMIEHELGITYGSWKSLPFKFIFLFDGLDEMLQHDTQAFYDNLASTVGGHNYILTVRDTGIGVETSSKSIHACFSIQPLSYRSAFNIASDIFKGDELLGFYSEYRNKLSTIGYNFLSSPFVLSLSIDYYKINNSLPKSIEDVIEDWISNKIKSDKKRVTDVTIKLNRVPVSKIEEAFSLILYKASFEKNITSISEDTFIELIEESYDELASYKGHLTRLLDLHEFISMVHHYEILYQNTDGYYTTPHAIISDYLSSKLLSRKWRKYKSTFINSHYDIWLYCSNFIVNEDREDYLNTVFNFDICLGAKIANKFQGSYTNEIQNRLLNLEQCSKVLTRSNAISALGILGTESCYNRLKSQEGYQDQHHPYQRLRALALNGDREILLKIISENEHQVQAPIKISGGEYDLWFNSPPAIITDIARGRVEEWLNNKRPPLCMSLRTLALFGDSFDINMLISVLENTDEEQEFYDAAKALFQIDNNSLIEALSKIITEKQSTLYWAKQFLFSIGIECSVDDEFNYFIEQSEKKEEELARDEHLYSLGKLVDFIKKTKLDDKKIKILISVYKSLGFKDDFYYNRLIWSLARNGKPGSFLPIVALAYERKIPEEINNAICYLSYSDELTIDSSLEQKIDDYFESLNGKYEGIFQYYIHYYYKHKSKSFALSLINKKITEKLRHLSPESIARENYIGSFFEYNMIFDFLSDKKCEDINLCEKDAIKFLLIDTECSDDNKIIKLKILSSIDKEKLNYYSNRIIDPDVKISAINYLLINDLAFSPISFMEKYLLILLSHYMFYPTIEHVCKNEWDDRLANLFLESFIEYDWDHINAQMFEKYINVFLTLITKEQLEIFEKKRVKPISLCIERIYKIWLESNDIN
ncbi:restriction endonuclease [Psychromonas sp. L1A2]|uniref:restriction endonuclease n=1 Tax=Psychromonas sp. L1A2 TaxID=2686356 RepID=UPI001358B08A|nr:restriction endonuclease [Psychromonas sp. L1A2]